MFPGYRLPQSGMIQHLRANGAREMRTAKSEKLDERVETFRSRSASTMCPTADCRTAAWFKISATLPKQW